MGASPVNTDTPSAIDRGVGRWATFHTRALRYVAVVGAMVIIGSLLTLWAAQAYAAYDVAASKTQPGVILMAVSTAIDGQSEIGGVNQCNNRLNEHPGSCCQKPCCSSCSVALIVSLPIAAPSQVVALLAKPPQNRLSGAMTFPAFKPPRYFS